ncbi:MAG: 50S ribosomal protein L19 [Bacilli bacterium]
MNKNIVKEITARQIRNDIPSFASGDTVKVSVRITENGKTRIQNFEGIVMERRGGGIGETFTVRKMSGAVGVERTWSLNSPVIASIQLLKIGKVRRNKIYYLRDLRGKSARIKEVLKK